MSNQVDLNQVPDGHSVNFKVEPVETRADASVRLVKDVLLFLFALAVIGTLLYVCYQTVTGTAATADEKKWAMSILTAVGGGLVGYLVRK